MPLGRVIDGLTFNAPPLGGYMEVACQKRLGEVGPDRESATRQLNR
jgi:hypothetical protein